MNGNNFLIKRTRHKWKSELIHTGTDEVNTNLLTCWVPIVANQEAGKRVGTTNTLVGKGRFYWTASRGSDLRRWIWCRATSSSPTLRLEGKPEPNIYRPISIQRPDSRLRRVHPAFPFRCHRGPRSLSSTLREGSLWSYHNNGFVAVQNVAYKKGGKKDPKRARFLSLLLLNIVFCKNFVGFLISL